MFREVKLESFSGVELSCPDVVVKRTSVFRVIVYSAKWTYRFCECALLSWMNSILSVKLFGLHSSFIARFLESSIDVTCRDCELFCRTLSSLFTVGLTFVLRVFLYVFYISCTMIFNTHLLQENRVVNYNPS